MRRGFTIVELLVVIAVIALLLGVLLPALSGARHAGRVMVSMNNMRQLGVQTLVFAESNRGELMRSTHSFFTHYAEGAQPWYRSFYEMMTGREFDGVDARYRSFVDGILRSPLDPREVPERLGPFDPEYNGSYGFNVYFELTAGETPDGRVWRRLSMSPSPSETVVFGEVSEGASGAHARDHIMAHFWVGGMAPAGREIARDRNRPGSGYVFLDGHARNMGFVETFDEAVGIDRWNPNGAKAMRDRLRGD